MDDFEVMAAIAGEIAGLIDQITQDLLGFPPYAHVVRPARLKSPGLAERLPESLCDMYQACDGMELPDVWNGYWIDTGEDVGSRAAREDAASSTPSRIAPRPASSPSSAPPSWPAAGEEVVVIGSDGGGGRFAHSLDDGSVLYLPSEGSVVDGVYGAAPRLLAGSPAAFMQLLLGDVQAFIRQERGWTYLDGLSS